MTSASVSLDDKYALKSGTIYLNGTQALVRLALLRIWRDEAAGLKTGGFISGYRGSPLGSFDRELWRASKHLAANRIRFWPGVNEDLAATAVWGSQMVGQHGDATVDGAFGLWYGKGAGLDRCGDVMRHANAAGVHPAGGVLAVVGDDHAQKSSTQAYFSEPTFADLLMPVLYPATIGEMLEYGLLGWDMSRFTGAWVGLKTMAELLDCSTSLDDQSYSLLMQRPREPLSGAGAVHFRWPDPWPQSEVRWVEHKLPAIHAFARANNLDRVIVRAQSPRLGIVTAGKSYQDLLQALQDLGSSLEDAAARGVSIYKIGMTWPLELTQLRAFAAGIPEILVIEEKRPIIEDQMRSALFELPERPRITGKKDESGRVQFPWVGELGPDRIARVLARKLGLNALPLGARQRLAALEASESASQLPRPKQARPPYFCSGCPHNTSTKVPDGSQAIAGVGCHYMAVDMARQTTTFSHMGGEGATWIGEAPFSKRSHVFVNLGEGTYFHSGSLAVRACIAAGVNITYKLLYNDAVAMTGGQPVDGQLTVTQLAQQLHAEGIRGIRVVAEEPERHTGENFPPGTTIHPRSDLDSVQRELRDVPGVTALIYDQVCAAEKRRRRKRAQLPDPPRRAFINTGVCEGCGDCSRVSNCLSIVPVETPLGRKRAVDQSSCNKDLSCVEGFCPSFVTVSGGKLRRRSASRPQAAANLPEARIPPLEDTYDIFITGIGGTGVVTIGGILGMAAHLEGKSCTVLDQLGMAQKGGAVVSHIRIGAASRAMHSVRVPTSGADLILALDLTVGLQDQAFGKIAPMRTRVLLNTHEAITSAFIRDADAQQPTREMVAAVVARAGADFAEAFDATALATALCGDSIATNLFALGWAWQKGLVPLSRAAIIEAVRINGVAVELNIDAFEFGRRAALDLHAMKAAAGLSAPALPAEESLESLVEQRAKWLTAYQDASYARSYTDFIAGVQRVERERVPGRAEFRAAVARSLYKLMAYKDEYEVARLYTDGTFGRALQESFEGDVRLKFHLAPPLLGARDPRTGHLRKRTFGAWVMPFFGVLARLKGLRGTRLDVFGYTEERRMERRLIQEYRAVVARLMEGLTRENHALAVRIAELPLSMRGFGHVKEANIKLVLERQALLLEEFAGTAAIATPAQPLLESN